MSFVCAYHIYTFEKANLHGKSWMAKNNRLTSLLEYLSCGCMKKVLFVCVENAGRSQMAEAFAKRYGKDKIEALSAGTMPSGEVNRLSLKSCEKRELTFPKTSRNSSTTEWCKKQT